MSWAKQIKDSLNGSRSTPKAGTAPTLPPADSQGIFEGVDGTRLYYETRGQGRPLIFAYGLTCMMRHWRFQIEHLMSRYQCITLDYRGHHRAELPVNEQHLTLRWCAKDILALMDHLDLKEVACLGHSMGVPILAQLSELAGPRLHSLVFVCGSVENPFQHMFHSNKLDRFYRVSSKLYQFAPKTVDRIWHNLTKENPVNYFLTARLGFNPVLSNSHDVRMYLEGVHHCPLITFQKLLEDYQNFNGYELLPKLELPILILAGEADYITPIHLADKMAGLLPQSELAKIPDGSHNAHMDFPGLVNRRIDEFLKRVQYL